MNPSQPCDSAVMEVLMNLDDARLEESYLARSEVLAIMVRDVTRRCLAEVYLSSDRDLPEPHLRTVEVRLVEIGPHHFEGRPYTHRATVRVSENGEEYTDSSTSGSDDDGCD